MYQLKENEGVIKGVDLIEQCVWLEDYFSRYQKGLFDQTINQKIADLAQRMKAIRTKGRKIIIAGNGGSAAMASHVAVDFTKQTGTRTLTFNDVSLITCYANDFGYENWLAKAIQKFTSDGDMVVLISCSGTSPNMVNAANTCKSLNRELITLTGFEEHNAMNQHANLNFWVNSRAYNVIECIHQIWLLAACDLIKGAAEYSAHEEYDMEESAIKC